MFPNNLSRRTMLKTTASGFGYLAFAGLSTWAAEQAANPLALPRSRTSRRSAKPVIFLCMKGGPSHVRYVRLQAAIDHRRREAVHAGPTMSAGRDCSDRRGNSHGTARAASGYPSSIPRRPSTSTTCASCAACKPICQAMHRRSCRCTPAFSRHPGPRLVRGRCTGSAPKMKTCPASSRSVHQRVSAAPAIMPVRSCRRSIRARGSAATRKP